MCPVTQNSDSVISLYPTRPWCSVSTYTTAVNCSIASRWAFTRRIASISYSGRLKSIWLRSYIGWGGMWREFLRYFGQCAAQRQVSVEDRKKNTACGGLLLFFVLRSWFFVLGSSPLRFQYLTNLSQFG